MDIFLQSASIVAPLFGLMAVGFLAGHFGVLKDETVEGLNDAVYKFFLPVMLFNSVYHTQLHEAFDLKLILFAYISVLIITCAGVVLIPKIEKDRTKCGVLVQALFRGNFVIFGLPLSQTLLGKDNTGPIAILIAVVTPLFNIIAVTVLEYFAGTKPRGRDLIKSVTKNPLVIASFIGVLFLITGVSLPALIEGMVESVSEATSPLALVGLGATIKFKNMLSHKKQIIIGGMGKLVLTPLIGVTAAVLCGFRGASLVAIFSMFSTPVAVSSFAVTKGLAGDEKLAGELIVSTCAFSAFTIFIGISLLMKFGLLS